MKYIYALFFLVGLNAFSQSVTGIVMDGEYNEPLVFANVLIKGTTTGTTTDFDGKFVLEVDPGTYTLVFSFVGYDTVEITDINVDNTTKENFIEVTLLPSANQLDSVVITTTSKRNSEASVLNLQKRSVTLVDGLSIQSIKKSGDSDVAGAIKRVPGISVQGGKYVYVRGLGDRYSKTLLNGMELPGLDPDRNTIPMDIFPTNIIENILVKKSASAEIGADFTGGTVDITLKDFSFNPTYNVSFSAGYNPDMHFNSNFLEDETSSTDWLARDDGLRDLPIDPNLDLPPALPNPLISAEEAAVLTDNTRKLNKTLAPIKTSSNLNYSFAASASNGYKFKEDGEASIGYLAAIGYKSQTVLYEDFFRGNAFLVPNTDGYITNEYDLNQTSVLGRTNNYVSALLGVSFKNQKNKIGINYISLLNGESNAQNLERQSFIENPYFGVGSTITYTQRKLVTIPLYGKHSIGNGNFRINWKVAKSNSTLNDKDFRRTIFETDSDQTYFQLTPNTIAAPSRTWRDLDEEGVVGKLDFELDIDANSFTGKLGLGASYIDKERNFDSKNFDIFYSGNSQVLEGNPNNILADENIWVQSETPFEISDGSYIQGGFERTNIYFSELDNTAYYFSAELKFSDVIKVVMGTRFETFSLRYTGEDLFGTEFNREKFIDDKDAFSNINLIISPNEKSNIRISYYKTTARPSFKEASTAFLVDPVQEQIFVGNPDIQSAYIDNYDLRYEYFGKKNQMFAISLFAKQFEDPIEVAVVSENTPNDFTVVNNEEATVLGIELEVRKNILTTDKLTLNFSANGSYIDAKQTMSDAEYESRLVIAENNGETIDRERELQGQSPYMINAGLVGKLAESELEAGLFYNVQGQTLQIVGFGTLTDVYTEPFNNLDLSISKVFSSKKVKKKVSFKMKNLLQDKRQSFYVFNDKREELFSSYSPGILLSLGVSLEF
ncbi:TonB-dependent receptor [Winogradskyella endarachnes]|uniref:TonB-dependent receptor plug domain-containing protein n=1 Tax=Winogradskyella endarachnes TaxID=2681965 RepID=A0A6L6UCS1_9FLAO|nr:TonB-dependent receptor [Winogradskyella endarachnes]MUU79326.1 TonB-dependent receptor plug domain-containing protein [Winogradskyella endarachnes]